MRYILPLFLFPAVLLADDAPPANPLMDQFLKKGIEVPGVKPFQVPLPLVKPDMKPAELETALEKAKGRAPLSLFLGKSFYAPHNLQIQSINDAKELRQGQYIKLHFIAYGKLDTVLKKNMLNQLIGGAKGKSEILDADELKKRGLEPMKGRGIEEEFGVMDMELLEKVKILGITRNVRTTHGKSAYMTTLFDDRFAKENTWQHVNVKKKHPYTGLAGYVFVTELPEPKGALYLEMHYVLHEPQAWFKGPEDTESRNLLKSKLPAVIKNNVENFRRKLAKGE